MALFKLWLVRGDEIVAQPHTLDALWNVVSADEWYWFGSYVDRPFRTPPFIRLPAYPLWIALIRETGCPLRVASEVLYLIAAFALAVALVRTRQSRWLAVLLYAAIVFNPFSFSVSLSALPDFFYGAVLLALLASMLPPSSGRDGPQRLSRGITMGLLLGVLWYTRQENVLIVAWLVVYAGLVLLVAHGHVHAWTVAARRVVAALAVPVAVLVLVSLAVKTMNLIHFGVFADSEMETAGWKAAAKGLLRVEPSPPMRLVAAPREVRARVYEVSPAFRELQPFLEGSLGQRMASYTENDPGMQGEIGAGYFWWTLLLAARAAGHDKSAAEAEAYYQRIADEIDVACNDGRLRCRSVPFSPLDPHVANYLAIVPSSMRLLWSMFFAAPVPALKVKDDVVGLPQDIRELFDKVANRRSTLNDDLTTAIRGWALPATEPLEKVLFRATDGRILASATRRELTPRPAPHPDAGPAKSPRAVAPSAVGFRLELQPRDAGVAPGGELVFVAAGGKESVVPFWLLLRTVGALSETRDRGLKYVVENVETSGYAYRREDAIQTWVARVHAGLLGVLTYVALGSVGILAGLRRVLNLEGRHAALFASLALLAAIIVTRLALFALFDASAWITTNQPRYVFPVMPLYSCVVLIVIAEAASVLRSWVAARGAEARTR